MPLDLTLDSTEVAPALLGCHLRSTTPDGTVTVLLTEVEAYAGESDPASHAFRGRTRRNEVMFGAAGHAYVYRSHGLHWCLNLVTGEPGTANAVLLRAGRVVDGVDLARSRRGAQVPDRNLARGPGNFAQALGVTGDDDGTSVLDGPRLRLLPAFAPPGEVVAGPRVGVTLAPDEPWRWWVRDDPSVSAYRRSPRARPAFSTGPV